MTAKLRTSANGIAALLAVAAAWFWTWRHLAIEWHYNDQYAYGYAVPWLGAFLAWSRLRQCPDGCGEAAADRGAWGWRALTWVAILLFLLAELFRRQDPTWRLVGWLLTSAATILTIGWLGQVGGERLVLTLAFPIGFLWLALPWPSFVETPVTLGLLDLVTRITTDALNWAGIAGLQRGNTIELRNCLVGVDAACSGVQSFQAAVMATLFLGEYSRLSLAKRLSLVVGGVVAAFTANLIRVFVLARFASQQGASGVDQYHDPIGAAATIGLFLSILCLAWILSPRPASSAPSSTSRAPALRWPGWRLTGWHGVGLMLAVALVPVVARGWFQSGLGRTSIKQTAALWQLSPARLPAGWRVTPDPFSPEEIRLLRFSQGISIDLWSMAVGQATVMHLFWAPDATVPSQAFSHTPEICMPSAGWQPVGQPHPLTVVVGGVPVHGAMFTFRQEGLEQAVFHAIWYGGEPLPYSGSLRGLGNRASRFALLWRAPVRLGHEALTVFVAGEGSSKQRNRRVEEVLEAVLTPNPKVVK